MYAYYYNNLKSKYKDNVSLLYIDANKHDIIVIEAFRAALFRVKIAASEGGSEGACFIRRFQ